MAEPHIKPAGPHVQKAETHVLSALKSRRSEMAREVKTLTVALTHLDATIRLFEAGKPPKARQWQISRAVFQVMREAGGPLTAQEIADKVNAPIKRVMGTLCYQRSRGRVRQVVGDGRVLRWGLLS